MEKNRKDSKSSTKYPAPYSQSWAGLHHPRRSFANRTSSKINDLSASVARQLADPRPRSQYRETAQRTYVGQDPTVPHLKYGIFRKGNVSRGPSRVLATKLSSRISSVATDAPDRPPYVVDSKRLKMERPDIARATTVQKSLKNSQKTEDEYSLGPVFVFRPLEPRSLRALAISPSSHLDIKPVPRTLSNLAPRYRQNNIVSNNIVHRRPNISKTNSKNNITNNMQYRHSNTNSKNDFESITYSNNRNINTNNNKNNFESITYSNNIDNTDSSNNYNNNIKNNNMQIRNINTNNNKNNFESIMYSNNLNKTNSGNKTSQRQPNFNNKDSNSSNIKNNNNNILLSNTNNNNDDESITYSNIINNSNSFNKESNIINNNNIDSNGYCRSNMKDTINKSNIEANYFDANEIMNIQQIGNINNLEPNNVVYCVP